MSFSRASRLFPPAQPYLSWGFQDQTLLHKHVREIDCPLILLGCSRKRVLYNVEAAAQEEIPHGDSSQTLCVPLLMGRRVTREQKFISFSIRLGGFIPCHLWVPIVHMIVPLILILNTLSIRSFTLEPAGPP